MVLFSFLDTLSRYGLTFEIPAGGWRAVNTVGNVSIVGKCFLVSDEILNDVNLMRERVDALKKERIKEIRLAAEDIEIIKKLSE